MSKELCKNCINWKKNDNKKDHWYGYCIKEGRNYAGESDACEKYKEKSPQT